MNINIGQNINLVDYAMFQYRRFSVFYLNIHWTLSWEFSLTRLEKLPSGNILRGIIHLSS